MTQPNLFVFATSELSQDAFVCWLLSWADPMHHSKNELLHDVGRHFVQALYARAGHQCPEAITRVEIKKQYKNIDILAIVNDTIPLLIEDKTHTKDHSDQLARYRETVKQSFAISEFPAIYLKTGDQSSYTDIEQAGYAVFGRKDLLAVLKKGIEAGVKDQIFTDFYEYLFGRDALVRAFRTIPVAEWDSLCWTGFYIELQELLDDGSWDYVPNPSGGFMGFWWHRKQNKYLQLEEHRLCFKIAVEENDEQSWQRNDWHDRLIAASAGANLRIIKPARFGRGTWMTAAIVGEDYRRCNGNGVLNLAATVERLREAERFMDTVLTVA